MRLRHTVGLELSAGGSDGFVGRTMRFPTATHGLARCLSGESGMIGAIRSGFLGISIVTPQVRSDRLAA
jgi:hypothetical protein